MSESMEIDVLQRLIPDLEAEGYEVYVHPKRPLIPTFLSNFQPDAVAMRADKNLIVEVMRASQQTSKKLEQLSALIEGQENWELRVIWVEPTTTQVRLDVQNEQAIQQRIDEIGELGFGGHNGPALLTAWATFEALARAVLTPQFERPQTPGRLVQVLAAEGYLTPAEADHVRPLAQKRNRLIHGDLEVQVSDDELEKFLRVLKTMLRQIPKNGTKSSV